MSKSGEYTELNPIPNREEARRRSPLSDSHAGDAMDLLVARAKRFRENYEAEDVEFPHNLILWARRNAGLIFTVLVTLAYLAIEATWNLGLVEAVGDKATTRENLDLLILEGRLLAAFGLTWAIAKAQFLKRTSLQGHVVNVFIVACSVVALYVGIGKVYEVAIDEIPAAESMAAYKLASHRQTADTEKMSPVSIAIWPIALMHPESAAGIDKDYNSRRARLKESLTSKLDPEWARVEKARNALGAADPKQLAAAFEGGYQRFIEGSKRVERALLGRSAATEGFKLQSGGLEPNSALTREGFAHALAGSRFADQARLGGWWLRTGGTDGDTVAFELEGVQVMASELAGIDRDGFRRLLERKLGLVVDEKLPTLATVKSNPTSHDVVASVVLPPIAMTLSLLAVIANAGALLGLLLSKVPLFLRHQALFPVVAVALAMVLAPQARLGGLEAAQGHLRAEHPAVELVVSKVAGLEAVLADVLGAGNAQ